MRVPLWTLELLWEQVSGCRTRSEAGWSVRHSDSPPCCGGIELALLTPRGLWSWERGLCGLALCPQGGPHPHTSSDCCFCCRVPIPPRCIKADTVFKLLHGLGWCSRQLWKIWVFLNQELEREGGGEGWVSERLGLPHFL